MNDTLTNTDADAIFRKASQAIASGDDEKLESLFSDEEDQELEQDGSDAESTEELESDDSTSTEDQTAQDETEDDKEEVTPASQDDPAKQTQVKEAVEPDELTKLKEQLGKLQKENHSLKSAAGRVPWAQSRITQLEKKLAELDQSKSPSNLPSGKIGSKLQEKLEKIRKTDPELADAIYDSVITASDEVAAEQADRHKETLTTLRDNYMQQQAEEQLGILLEAYPNAQEVFASESYKNWKKEQRASVQQLASSSTAEDVMLAFELYAKDMVAKYPELAEKKEPVVNDKAAQIEQKRQQKKETTTNVRNPSAAGKVKLSDDPDALFKLFSEQIMKDEGY